MAQADDGDRAAACSRTSGQDLIEYGLLAALIAIVAMVGVSALGNTIYNVFWKQHWPGHLISSRSPRSSPAPALGAAIDLWTRRVPNPLTMGLAAIGVVLPRAASAASRSARRWPASRSASR